MGAGRTLLPPPRRGATKGECMPEQSVFLDGDQIAAWVLDAHARTVELVEDLSDEQLIGPQLATVNPLIWEIGHLAWFQERFVLRQTCQEEPILPFADAIWDSGTIPHDTRWRLQLPTRQETLTYMGEVANRVADRAAARTGTDVVRHFALYTVAHHDMHTEAITYTRQALGYPAPPLTSVPAQASGSAEPAGGAAGDVEVPGCRYLLGATRDQPFVFDHEKWAHPVAVPEFAIARRLVTQGEFAAFVDDRGYERPELWSTPGWEWRQAAGATQPVYWQLDGAGWSRRHFDVWVPLEADLAMIHVSYHEVEAYCRWARRRLPTEAEWEVVASTTPGQLGADLVTDRRAYPWGDEFPTPAHAPLDWQGMGPSPVGAYPAGDSAHGCRQLVGNVWQWTATTFLPYPNFERDAYRDNAEPWFGSRKVLRGGAWATRSRFVRNTFRNYFTPDRRDVLAGFRTCSLER
jgi:iron(II)-dependent oxidoreductase